MCSASNNSNNKKKYNLIWKKVDIDLASIVAEEIINPRSGRRR